MLILLHFQTLLHLHHSVNTAYQDQEHSPELFHGFSLLMNERKIPAQF